jgi:tetratricopeptide (TPR) repeat protein
MKNWLLIIVVVLFFTLDSGAVWPQTQSGIENHAIRNPVGLSTVPLSSFQSGLYDNPNPVDTSSNLVITGNIRRGRHFRGTMPYQSATSFRTTLGSTSLQSFLRDSASAEDFGRYTGKYRTRPYYSPTETVATTRPGRSGVFKPAGTRISSRAPDAFGLEPLALSSRSTSVSDIRLWGPQTQYSALRQPQSISLSPQEIEQLARRELGIYQRGERLDRTEGIRQQYQSQPEGTANAIKGVWEPELLWRGLKQIRDESAELQQNLAEKDDSLRRLPQGGVSEGAWSAEGRYVMRAPREQMEETSARRSTLGAAGLRGDEFTPAGDSALRKDPILWGPQTRDAALDQSLERAPKWEGEPKVGEGIAGPGNGDTGRLRGFPLRESLQNRAQTLRPLQQQGQRDGFADAKEGIGGPDVLERIRQQLDDLTKSVDERLQAGSDSTGQAGSPEGAGQRTVRSRADFVGLDLRGAVPLYEPKEAADDEIEVSEEELYFDQMLGETGTRASSGERSFALDALPNAKERVWGLDELDELSQADRPTAGMTQPKASLRSVRAKRIMGSHKSVESFSEAKFNQHIWDAESYLRQGRYYRAADSFALASIYKVDAGKAGSDPAQAFGLALSLAGRSHALFAAGEYMSSALFLSRAIEVDPEYARTEIDLVTILGGKDKLQSRMADIKEWLKKSGSGQLHFLLGYVYYRIGKLHEAKEAIDAAYEKMPQSPAADTVKKAIDDAIAAQ